MFERLKSTREGRTSIRYDIVCTVDGVQLHWLTPENETGSLAFAWDTVSAVDVYKRDCLIVDCVCLAFETPDGWYELNEDMTGWDVLLDKLERQLREFPAPSEWWQKVVIPAFTASHLRLWTRTEHTSSNLTDKS